MKKITIIIVILALIVVGFFGYKTYMAKSPVNSEPVDNTGLETNSTANNEMTPTSTGSTQPVPPPDQATVREFTVFGNNYSFNPSKITVKKGDIVKITFKDDDGFHDLKIDGYNVATQRVNTGGESSVQFVALKSGSFEYYCSVDSHREKGMKGTFTVME